MLTIITPTPVSTHILCHKTSLVESSSVETRSCDVALQHAVIDVPVRPVMSVDMGIYHRHLIIMCVEYTYYRYLDTYAENSRAGETINSSICICMQVLISIIIIVYCNCVVTCCKDAWKNYGCIP